MHVDGLGAGIGEEPFRRGQFLCLGPSRHTIVLDGGGTCRVLLERHGNGGAAFFCE